MALDLPLSPSLNDIYQAGNGINYQWDGEKWVVFVDPASGTNVWTRDNSTTTVYPILMVTPLLPPTVMEQSQPK